MQRDYGPRGLVDILVSACVGFLLCVLALTLALYLLARIWFWLVLIALVIGFACALVRWLRWHRGGW